MTKTTGEQWKAITHYKNFTFTGKYEISSWGRIRNRETKTELATYSNQRGQGYLKTKIIDTKGTRRALYIHQLVDSYLLPGCTGHRRTRCKPHRWKHKEQQLHQPGMDNPRPEHEGI